MRHFVKTHVVIIMLSCLSSSSSMSANLTEGVLSWCKDALVQCAFAITNGTDTYPALIQCQDDYDACAAVNFTVCEPRSQECLSADAGWSSVRTIALLTAGAYFGATLAIPHFLAVYAHYINKMSEADENEHPYRHAVGKWLVKVRDADGDGKVSLSDLSKPATYVYGIVSINYLSQAISTANQLQAVCDYASQCNQNQ